MTLRDYFLVVGVALLGLVPSFAAYHSFVAHPELLAAFTGSAVQDEQVSRAWAMASAAQSLSRAAAVEVYVSKPRKETRGLCVNSYYMSYTLILSATGAFSLQKSCESARDTGMVWMGTASTTWSASTDSGTTTPESRGFTIERATYDTLTTPLFFALTREGDMLTVIHSSLSDLATSTSFLKLPSPRIR